MELCEEFNMRREGESVCVCHGHSWLPFSAACFVLLSAAHPAFMGVFQSHPSGWNESQILNCVLRQIAFDESILHHHG